MKKSLVNQWHIVNRNFSLLFWFSVLHVLQLAFGFAVISDGLVIAALFSCLLSDGYAAKWKYYSRVLPISVFERVTASFIFAVAEMLIAFASILAASAKALGIVNALLPLADFDVLPDGVFTAVVAVLYFVAASIITSFCFVASHLFKRVLPILGSTIIIMAMFLLLIFLIVLKFETFLPAFLSAMNDAPWLLAFVAVFGLLLLPASWLAVLGIETVNNSRRKKRFFICAVIVLLISVLSLGAEIGYSYSKGYIVLPENNEEYLDGNETTTQPTASSAEVEAEKRIMDKLSDFLADGIAVDLTFEELDKRMESIGYIREGNKYVGESSKTEIGVTGDDTVTEFTVYNKSSCNTAVMTLEEYDSFSQKYRLGMSETDFLQLLEQENIYIGDVTEYYDFADGYEDRVIVRKYNIYIHVSRPKLVGYSSNAGMTVDYHTLTVHIADGKAVFVKMY